MKMGKRKILGWILTGIGMLSLLFAAGLTGYNLWEDNRAQKASAEVLSRLKRATGSPEAFDYSEISQREMPTRTVDGEAYIGMLSVPSVSLELPVMAEWSYPKLKTAPCRYSGSAYTDDLVIAAHNYDSHFGKLFSVEEKDTVVFTDMDGNQFQYSVSLVKVLPPTATEEMQAGEYDLTLFTCTYGGAQRVTVCCDRIQ